MSNQKELDDALDFIAMSDQFKAEETRPSGSLASLSEAKREDKEPEAGTVCQYALFRDGYMPATATIKTLKAGLYEIKPTQQGVYASPLRPPPSTLLELEDMQSADVIRASERFWNSEKDYKEGNQFVNGGALFKGGLLIYGPAGSGKTSTLRLINQKLASAGGVVFYAACSPYHVEEFLGDFTKIENNRKIIVILEDLDTLIYNHGESGYLSMLDSTKSINNVLFIATTNYPEKLDPRIYNRPGRFSHVIKIGLPSEIARRSYLKAILKDHRDVEEIVSNTKNFTIDHLTALINGVYREGKTLQDEMTRLKSLFKIKTSDEDVRPMGIGMRNDD